ncbi:MAG: hypothetical protein HRT69_08040 [Flavobacteriaceae bacterium]|nr:hypothetical protein [Flavobacteriaceae bacterium]
MKKITPYKTTRNAITAMDNGGRFYNLLTKANDGNVSTSELAKIAGVFSDKQKMVLYLEMSLLSLDENSKHSVIKLLSNDLAIAYHKYKSQILMPSKAIENGIVSKNAIITGTPEYVTSNSDFNGFIMIPIMAGSVMTMTMIPIIDHYDVYKIRDQESDQHFLIAHARSSKKLPQQLIKCGGILKELKTNKKVGNQQNKFLETVYYSVL